jgi:hypothetical protein
VDFYTLEGKVTIFKFITADTRVNNEASQKLLQKLGFEFERTFYLLSESDYRNSGLISDPISHPDVVNYRLDFTDLDDPDIDHPDLDHTFSFKNMYYHNEWILSENRYIKIGWLENHKS